MKFFLGVLSGAILTFAGLFGLALYLKSPSAQVSRCMDLYRPAFEEMNQNPEIQAKMKEEGFANLEDMTRDRCENWVRNGQQF